MSPRELPHLGLEGRSVDLELGRVDDDELVHELRRRGGIRSNIRS